MTQPSPEVPAPSTTLDEHRPGLVRAVGHQPVDTTVEQLAHLVGVVDRPHVDVLADRVRAAYEPRRADDPRGPAVGNLEGRDPAPGEPVRQPTAGQQPERDDLGRMGGGRDPATGESPEGFRRRGEKLPTRSRSQASRSATKAARAAAAPADLRSMLNRASGNASKSSAERRDPLAPADQRLGHLGPGQLRDRAAPVGDPVQHPVVEGQQHAVTRDVDVGLEVVVAERHGVLERRHGVLEALDLRVVGTAAVRERQDRAGTAQRLVEVVEPGARQRHDRQYSRLRHIGEKRRPRSACIPHDRGRGAVRSRDGDPDLSSVRRRHGRPRHRW